MTLEGSKRNSETFRHDKCEDAKMINIVALFPYKIFFAMLGPIMAWKLYIIIEKSSGKDDQISAGAFIKNQKIFL